MTAAGMILLTCFTGWAWKIAFRLIFGCRSFNRKVPFRCALGNRIARLAYLLLVGRYFKDTQTGLRGIPISLLPILTEPTSMRFAYEMEVLLVLHNRGIPVKEIPITAVYKKKNLNSHYRPLMDSYQISCILILWCLKARLLRLPKLFAWRCIHENIQCL